LNIGTGAPVKVVDFSDFGESDTDNGWLHGEDYTVLGRNA
jgi:hypothetical protein